MIFFPFDIVFLFPGIVVLKLKQLQHKILSENTTVEDLVLRRWSRVVDAFPNRSENINKSKIVNSYPLVMTNIAIENGHRNSGFSH